MNSKNIYEAAPTRHDSMSYRRCGRSGLKLPAISLGLWQNFGGDDDFEVSQAMLRHAFDYGITHFDLANNYGPPYGSAEETFGKVMASDFKAHRDELVISTKAGYDMWPGPYGDGGGSRKYLIASCDQSLKRMGLEYVDIFYSHCVDTETPLEETMGALATLHRQGKALYVGISSYSPERTHKACEILKAENIPLLIHQPSYSMMNRWVEDGLLQTLDSVGAGCIAFSVLAQGFLSDKYTKGIPSDARAAQNTSFSKDVITEENLERIRGLSRIAQERGQTLSQMAIAWVLRDPRVTSALIGARTVDQLAESIASLNNLSFSEQELSKIDTYAADAGVDLWRASSDL